MSNILLELYSYINIFSIHHYAFLFSQIISVSIKSFLFFNIIRKWITAKKSQSLLLSCLLTIVLAEIFNDISWFIHVYYLHGSLEHTAGSIFMYRIAWIFFILEYLCLGIFIDKLSKINTFASQIWLYIRIALSGMTGIYLLFIAISTFWISAEDGASLLELIILKIVYQFYIYILTIPSIIIALIELKKDSIPQILKQQLKVFIKYLIIPKLLIEFFNHDPFETISNLLNLIHPSSNYLAITISTLLMTYAIYFCSRKIMRLRFLNLSEHVHTEEKRFDFIEDFKAILEALGTATSLKEIQAICQSFFEQAFGIPADMISLHMPIQDDQFSEIHLTHAEHDERQRIVDQTLSPYPKPWILKALQKNRIFIKDEIEFTYFYEKNDIDHVTLQFFK